MNKDSGEIRDYEKIPPTERDAWSKPFEVGQTIEVLGVNMRIIKVKQMRKEIHLQFCGPCNDCHNDDPEDGCTNK